MKRVVLAYVLLIGMVGLSSWGLYVLGDCRSEMTKEIDGLLSASCSEDDSYCAERARLLTTKWIDTHRTLCRYVRHAQLDQVTLAMARLEPLAAYGEKGEFTAELMRCRILLDDIWDSELPLLRNIV